MKNYNQNKLLPLTIKQLKKAQQQLRSRKNKVYDSASYEVVWTVARVIKLSGMDLKITDQSDVLDLVVYPDPLKEATGLIQGAYFKFSFVPKKNVLKGSNVDGFAFQISGMKRVEPNQVTLHIATCLSQKLNRQKFKSKVITKSEQTTEVNIQPQEIEKISLNKQPNNTSNSLPSSSSPINKSKKMEQDITKYCKQLGSDFDIEKISGHFGSKYDVKEIEKVLELLSERGAIMDLGLVYEWVGQE